MKISSIDLHYLFILSPLLKSEIMTDGVIAQSLDKKDLYLLKMKSSIMLVCKRQNMNGGELVNLMQCFFMCSLGFRHIYLSCFPQFYLELDFINIYFLLIFL